MSRTKLLGKEALSSIMEDLKEKRPKYLVRSNYNPPAPALAEWVMKNYNLRDDLMGRRIGMMGWKVGERKN